jgi:hypothetical protein
MIKSYLSCCIVGTNNNEEIYDGSGEVLLEVN